MRQDKSILALLRKVRLILGVGPVPEIIFVFDRQSAAEPSLQQHGNKLRPIQQSVTRNAIAPPFLTVNTHLLQDRFDDLRVLGVASEDAIAEPPGRGDRVDILPDEVRGIVLQPQAVAGVQARRPFRTAPARWRSFPRWDSFPTPCAYPACQAPG